MMEGFPVDSRLLGGIGLLIGVYAYICGLARARKVGSFDLAKAHSKISFRQLAHIPTVGFSDPLASWWSAIKYFISADQVIQQGFDKVRPHPSCAAEEAKCINSIQYERGVFKVATLSGWIVILSPSEMDEVAKAPSNVLSGLDAVADVCSKNSVTATY